MNTKHLSLAFAAAAALLAGCAKSPIDEPSDGPFANLELSYVGATETKAAIDGTTFPETGEIGLFLFKDEQATKAYGDGYKNIKYAYNSTKKKWTASPSIKVGSTPGYLYGYYPYNSASTNVKAIPVSSSLNGDDVMYAKKQTAITDKTASQTSITMNHALARVSIKVINNGYTGKAELSKIKFGGAKTAEGGNLNALDGSITATKSDVTLNVPTANQTITAAGTTYECLLVPSDTDDTKQTVKLTLTMDGLDKEAEFSGDNGVIISQGTKSNITITLSDKGISVQTVSVEDWNVIEVGGHKVTVKLSDDAADAGIADDLIVQVASNGSSVIVKTYSDSGKKLVIRNDDATLIAPVEDRNKSTFTISNITKDITATMAYAKTRTLTINLKVDKAPDVSGYIYGKVDPITVIEGRPSTLTATSGEGFTFDYFKIKGTKYGNNEELLIPDDVETIDAYFQYTDWLGGVFSASTDRKIRFSKGNLYYSANNWKYHFDNNQYDAGPDEESYSHLGHFYWSSDESIAFSFGWYSDPDASSTDVFFTNRQDFIINGCSSWFTLSKDEWEYILEKRKTTYGTGVLSEDNHRYAAVKANNMPGLLLFPDEFTWPSEAGDEPQTFNTSSSDWNNLNLSISEFAALQNVGCAFLPAAGYRDGQSGNVYPSKVYSLTTAGYYSTASTASTDSYELTFSSSNVNPSDCQSRFYACSVRLVTESK